MKQFAVVVQYKPLDFAIDNHLEAAFNVIVGIPSTPNDKRPYRRCGFKFTSFMEAKAASNALRRSFPRCVLVSEVLKETKT